jgi:hypothetical protein
MRLFEVLKFVSRKLKHELEKLFVATFHKKARSYSDFFAEAPDFPSSAASPETLLKLTAIGTSQTLTKLIELGSVRPLKPITADELQQTLVVAGIEHEATRLRDLFDGHGSDKGSSHGYYALYAKLFGEMPESGDVRILEIGLGTNNTRVPSHMGPGGIPGASLRSWRDFSSRTQIVGLDVDADILFQDKRISTFRVDQLDPSSWSSLPAEAREKGFDLVIDDGLHSPAANLNTVKATLPMLRPGGHLVIEDVPKRALPVWDLASFLMGTIYQMRVYEFRRAYCVLISPKP